MSATNRDEGGQERFVEYRYGQLSIFLCGSDECCLTLSTKHNKGKETPLILRVHLTLDELFVLRSQMDEAIKEQLQVLKEIARTPFGDEMLGKEGRAIYSQATGRANSKRERAKK